MKHFPIAIHHDEGSAYGVTVPDLPGCFSAGDTLEEALVQAREAILGHMEALLETGQEIPASRPMEEHIANPDLADAIWAVVPVDLSNLPGKSVRINISMNERVLAVIDEFAARVGETRSGLLQRAASQYVAEERAGRVSPERRQPARRGRRKAS